MRQMTGKQSISFAKAVYIEGSAAIVGEKEKDGPLGEYFSHTLSDPMCGQESWEEGESELQLATAKLAMQKANVRPEQIRMIFAGDLLAQSIASSFGLVDLNCPLYGLFGACSTMGEALSLGAMAVAGGYGDRVLAVTSSHFGTAEKEFRFPLAYGNQRPPSASWTVTGSGACVLGKTKSRVKITGATTGKIIDYGLKDNQNMGACMARCVRYDCTEPRRFQPGTGRLRPHCDGRSRRCGAGNSAGAAEEKRIRYLGTAQ